MNILDKLRAAFSVNSAFQNIIKEVNMPSIAGKPGWKTTEFWGKIGIQVLTVFAAVKGFLPTQYAAIGTIGLEAIYSICRTVSKAVTDVQNAKVNAPTA